MSDLLMRRDAMTLPAVSTLGRGFACLCALALVVLFGFGVSSAGAVGLDPEAENFIPRFSEDGSGAGQLAGPSGIGVSPVTGDVYVADNFNDRISEFTPWGGFIRAFGWGVADGVSEELQACTSTCFEGLSGAGAGEFAAPDSVAVDSSGDVYVRDFNSRVQKFSSSGEFLLMFGGEVDRTQVQKREEQEAKAEPVTVTAEEEDVCTAVSGDQCGAGVEGSGHGQLDGNGGMALVPGGTVVVLGKERLEEFEQDGAYKSEVELPGKNVHYFAVDSTSGDFYIDINGGNVFKLSPTGAPLGTVEVGNPNNLAVDSAGHLFVADNGQRILEFDSAGKKLAEFDDIAHAFGEAGVHGFDTNTIGDLYVSNHRFPDLSHPNISFVSAYGPGPVVFEPPPIVPPTIDSEYAVSADQDSAVVQAQINPRFWSDATYYVQYGVGDCEVSACVSQPAAPGSKLTASPVAAPITTGGVFLSGLQPDATYHYRFVAESGGGGPVFGPDRTFTTFPVFGSSTDCANQPFRTGASALLGDCRAYEMVSPVDKDNSDIADVGGGGGLGYENHMAMSSTGGERFTYSSYRAFGDAKAAPFVSQYIAGRDPVNGWSTKAISPAQRPGKKVVTEGAPVYKFFSADLSSAWLVPAPEPALAPGAVEGFHNLYRRDNETGGFEALTTVKPPTLSPEEFEPELQGVAADGSHAVFRVDDKLTPDASSEKDIYQVYESYGSGNLRLVSVLPNGTASDQYSTVGSLNAFSQSANRVSSVNHAVSGDGSRVYWSTGLIKLGKIYLRENADQEQSVISGGECVEPGKACTVAVSSKASEFWTANADGSRALYTVAEGVHTGDLDEFDVEGTSTTIAGNVLGLLGASDDLSYVYFVSSEALAPGATVGQPNLYVRHAGVSSFVVTLSSTDTGFELSDINNRPVYRAARVTPDGRHIAFISTVSLTGYDNTDMVNGEPDSEVYTYDAESGMVNCVSCDRSGARPKGRVVNGALYSFPTAASIPAWENELYAARALSDAGDRVFFDSYVALVPRDTNGKEDVYEWEAAGSGDCSAQNPAFSTVNGGCVTLISSGESPQDSKFVDATSSGSDAFFVTGASLLPQDPGLIDVYDARVDGGFPAPGAPPAVCEGEACQGSPVPPNDQTPASATFSGPGDLVSALTGTVTPKKTAARARSIALAKVLRACRAKTKPKRVKSCEIAARKRYGAKSKSLAGKSNKRGKRS